MADVDKSTGVSLELFNLSESVESSTRRRRPYYFPSFKDGLTTKLELINKGDRILFKRIYSELRWRVPHETAYYSEKAKWFYEVAIQKKEKFFSFAYNTSVSESYLFNRDSKFRSDIRTFLEEIYIQYKPICPDSDFLSKAKREYYAMVWQMYLSWCLLKWTDVSVSECQSSQDEGPDIVLKNGVIVESVLATRGEGPDKPFSRSDYKTKDGHHHVRSMRFPDDQVILRITNAISEKCKQRERWIKSNIVNQQQPFIIAINAGLIEEANEAMGGSYGARSVFALGEHVMIVPIDIDAGKAHTDQIKTEIQFKPHVTKKNASKVASDLFLNDKFSHVSALIFSPFTIENSFYRPCEDLELILNPFAKYPVPHDLLKRGRVTWLEWGDKKENYSIRTEKIESLENT